MTAVQASREDTFPKLLARNASVRGARPAIRHKDLGIWQTWTWSDVNAQCRAFAVGLARSRRAARRHRRHRRLQPSAPLLVHDGRPDARRGPRAGLRRRVAEEMAYVLDHAEVKLAVVQDQEQVDKLLSIAERVPKLHRILYDEERGLRDYDHTRLHPLTEIIARGRRQASHRSRRRQGARRRASPPARARTSRSSSTPRARRAGPRA